MLDILPCTKPATNNTASNDTVDDLCRLWDSITAPCIVTDPCFSAVCHLQPDCFFCGADSYLHRNQLHPLSARLAPPLSRCRDAEGTSLQSETFYTWAGGNVVLLLVIAFLWVSGEIARPSLALSYKYPFDPRPRCALPRSYSTDTPPFPRSCARHMHARSRDASSRPGAMHTAQRTCTYVRMCCEYRCATPSKNVIMSVILQHKAA